MGFCWVPNPPEDAMKTLSRFVAKFTSLIVAVLSCFDRIIFKGHLPISNGSALEGFVDHVLKIRRCDFMAFVEQRSEALVEGARRAAEEAGVEYRFLKDDKTPTSGHRGRAGSRPAPRARTSSPPASRSSRTPLGSTG